MKLVFTLALLISQMTFAQNIFDASVFTGRFELDQEKSTATCQLNVHGPIQFVPSGKENAIKFIYENTDAYQIMEDINQGKQEFNSCFSDGYLGYRETVLKNNKIELTTTYLKPGFLCQGGAVKSVSRYAWEIRGDQFIEILDGQVYCTFKKL